MLPRVWSSGSVSQSFAVKYCKVFNDEDEHVQCDRSCCWPSEAARHQKESRHKFNIQRCTHNPIKQSND